jgi:rRNA biogenesis protein RRP5
MNAYSEGDIVRAIILDIETQRNRISFGLKASYFNEGDASHEENTSTRSLQEGQSSPQNAMRLDDLPSDAALESEDENAR